MSSLSVNCLRLVCTVVILEAVEGCMIMRVLKSRLFVTGVLCASALTALTDNRR